MPTGGKTCNANLIFLYAPFSGIFPDELYSALGILKRTCRFIFHRGIVWQAVFNHKSCDPFFRQPFCDVMALMIDSKNAVAPSGKNDHGLTTALFFREIGE